MQRLPWFVMAAALSALPGTAGAGGGLGGWAVVTAHGVRAGVLDVRGGDVGTLGGDIAVAKRLSASGATIAAPAVRMTSAASCGGIRADVVSGHAKACTQAGPFLPPGSAGALRACAANAHFACDDGNAVTVRGGDDVTLPPGTYGALVVRGRGTVHLADGDYTFCSITVGRKGTVDVGAATVSVAGLVRIAARGSLGGANPTAVTLAARGVVSLGRRAAVGARLCAPDGEVRAGNGASVAGQLIAGTVTGSRLRVQGLVPRGADDSGDDNGDSTGGAFCGNNVKENGEECDGTDLGGATCPPSSVDGAFDGSPNGAVVCTPDCTLDFSGCPGGGPTTTTTCPTTTTTTCNTTTTTTSTAICTTSTTEGSPSGSTTLPPTTLPSTTTTTTGGGSTTTTIITTTTTVVGTTSTTTPGPEITSVDFVTRAPSGNCGQMKDSGGNVIRALKCGGLDIGGGASTVLEGPTPDGATSRMTASCSGNTCTLGPTPTAGANFDCTSAGCFFGTPLPIANGGTSTCVINTFAANGGGTLNLATGVASLNVSLSSATFLTGNATQPCPKCSASGTPSNPGHGTCDRGANQGDACTSTNSAGLSRDCPPGGGDGSAFLGSLSVNLTPLTTGTASDADAGGLFCPGQGANQKGCFGSAACANISENGTAAGAITPGVATQVTLASVFCIPKTGNTLVDFAANLPGPGATSLPGFFRANQ